MCFSPRLEMGLGGGAGEFPGPKTDQDGPQVGPAGPKAMLSLISCMLSISVDSNANEGRTGRAQVRSLPFRSSFLEFCSTGDLEALKSAACR